MTAVILLVFSFLILIVHPYINIKTKHERYEDTVTAVYQNVVRIQKIEELRRLL